MEQAVSVATLTNADLVPGFKRTSARKQVTADEIKAFAFLTGDTNPIHIDETFASNTLFKRPIAHGALVVGLTTGLAYQLGIAKTEVVFTSMNPQFLRPVFVNDTIQLTLEVVDRAPHDKLKGRDELTLSALVTNQKDKVVIRDVWTVIIPSL